jgi:hypothetical protein
MRSRSLWCLSIPLLVAACGRAPADLREWKPEDHDRTEDMQKARAAPGRTQPASSTSASPLMTLVEVTWRNQCAACHGAIGHGDGPQGPMVHAPNLTLPDWQAKVTDAQIAEVIIRGKNRMPKFELPADVVGGLVARIRATKGR